MRNKRKIKAAQKQWRASVFDWAFRDTEPSDCDCGHQGLSLAFHMRSCPTYARMMATKP